MHLVGYFHSCITMHGFMNVEHFGHFRKTLRKVTYDQRRVSVCCSAQNKSTTIGQFFVKFYVED